MNKNSAIILNEPIRVQVEKLASADGIELPKYETALSAGADIRAAIPADQPMTLKAHGGRELVKTGLKIAIPQGYELQIRPRSGLALKHGVTCLNTPGTIDADYRGEIGVILINHGDEDFLVERAMRIAQIIIAPSYQLTWQLCDNLTETDRGDGGFGSTGLK